MDRFEITIGGKRYFAAELIEPNTIYTYDILGIFVQDDDGIRMIDYEWGCGLMTAEKIEKTIRKCAGKGK